VHTIETVERDSFASRGIVFADYFKDNVPGMFMEFGVFQGDSIRQIAALNPDRTVYGFDWFQGLPEDWGRLLQKGTFACEVPQVPDNVRLVVGMFQDTLPDFLKKHRAKVSFVHIDCDLYSSTKCILDNLAPRFVDGTVLAFDEIVGLPDCLTHEARAFAEFLNEYGFRYECIGHFNGNRAGFRIFKA
jgi:hypothetical protein